MEELVHDNSPIYGPASGVRDYASSDYDVSILALETTQRHTCGRRFLTWDGRVFRYCRSLGTLKSGYGAANIATQNIAAVPPAAYAAGDRTVLVTIASGDGYAADGAVAKDELIGGYFVTGHDEAAVCQTRLIEGNTAVASGGGTTTLTLDLPISNAITTSSYNEIVLNPYRYLSKGAYEYQAFMCVPAVNCTTGYWFWGQVRGPCFVVPGGGDASPGDTANDRMAYWVGDGSVNFGYSLTVESGYQVAGFCIDQTASGTSALPLIYLQLD